MSTSIRAQCRAVDLGSVRVGAGPAVVIGGPVAGSDACRLGLRDHHGGVSAAEAIAELRSRWPGPLLVEPFSAADLPAVREAADGVIVGAAWMQDFQLVRAVARLGLPVVVQRGPGATLAEWLAIAEYCVAEGNEQVVLCESGTRTHLGGVSLDLALMRAAKERSGRPVIVDLGGDPALAAAVVAAGADGLMLSADADVAEASEAVTVVGALVRPEAPDSVDAARSAIDKVDAALAVLLERRAGLAGAVQRLKPVGGFAGRDPARERALVAAMARRAPRLGAGRLGRVMKAVIEAGLEVSEEERRAGG
ncbi:chorismate mutase [Rhizohabitans arisaemae]|uniref:chorismate mutase n=1 Tax=Rhizohabitans arisaemae TaxID=2720610 RepID=UPI0031FE6070